MSWNFPQNPNKPAPSIIPAPGYPPGHVFPGGARPRYPQPPGAVICPPWAGMPPPGFVNGTIYKIRCAADSMVIDIKGNKIKSGGDVITYGDHGQPNQKFRATQCGTGFRLDSVQLGRQGETIALDYNLQTGKLSLWNAHSNPNQLFITQETHPGSQSYLIRCIHNNYCLRANGNGANITMAPGNPSDMMQHWKLEETYH